MNEYNGLENRNLCHHIQLSIQNVIESFIRESQVSNYHQLPSEYNKILLIYYSLAEFDTMLLIADVNYFGLKPEQLFIRTFQQKEDEKRVEK